MDIRILCCYIYISFVFIPYLDAKTFSLNNVIEKQTSGSPVNILETSGKLSPQSKKTSSLKYKKFYQIKSPSKPKKLKHLQRPRNKRKRLTSKREIHQNEKTNTKYIPLLRNIGMLFDNILNSGSSETYNTRKYKRNQFNSNDGDNVACTCISKYDSEDRSYSQKKISTTPTPKVENKTFSSIVITTTPSYNFTPDNISSFRWNKNIPLLLTRNTSSFWRNNNRFRERNGSSHNGSFKGYITGVPGNNEYLTIDRKRESDTQYYEKNSNGHSRDNTSSHRTNGGIRGIGKDSRNTKINSRTDQEFIFSTNETDEDFTRYLPGHEREIEFEIRRNETEGALFLPKFATRLREHKPQEKNTSIRTSESNEKSFAYDCTSNKRVFDRNGPITEEIKTNCRTDKTIMPLHLMSNSSYPISKVVMIFDGYSVAKDVNGENKRNETAIHIHS